MSTPRTQSFITFQVRAVDNGYIITSGEDPARCAPVSSLVARNDTERDDLVLGLLDTLVRRTW